MDNFSNTPPIFSVLGQAIYYFWWIIFPVMFYKFFLILWIDFSGWYSANSWFNRQKWILLEIIPPREIERGPKMMESIYTGISGVVTTYKVFDEYKEGAWFHDRFSLELVGDEGKIHFYIRAQEKYRNMVEAQVYAQYPDAQVLEVEDYTQNYPKVVPNKYWDMWGTDFEFANENPIPIRTYDKFEESVTGEMIDPMAAIAETLGTLGPGQHIWLQYILQPLPESEKEKYENVVKKLKGETVIEPMNIIWHLGDVFANFFNGLWGTVEFKKAEKEELQPIEFRLSPGEKELLKATEENLSRNLFRTKMRMVYLGRKENFDKAMVGTFIGSIKQFNDANMNQVKPEDVSKTYGEVFFAERRAAFRKRKIYDRYRRRNMDGIKIVFSTKELATLFHFPDMGVKSPAVPRTAAKLGSAPANLPVAE